MNLKSILTITLLSVTALALSVLLYARWLYPNADYIQIVITVLNLSPDVIKETIIPSDYAWGLLFFILVWPLCYLYLTPKKQLIAALFMGLWALYLTGWPEFMIAIHTTTTLYEEQYVYPDANIKAPQNKRNLILIYLESFEQNYTLPEHYGTNLIPHLNAMQKDGNYSAEYRNVNATQYSIAALVATHCGIPLVFADTRDMYDKSFFLPNAICFPEILKQNGYQTEIIKAADIHFTDADNFALSHGYEKAIGKNQIIAHYEEFKKPQYQGSFSGLSDRALYEVAKKELAAFSPDKPFLLTLFSLDTHTPLPHFDSACNSPKHDLREAYTCSDIAVNDFINWLKTSPYWNNTTVVLVGDHLLPAKINHVGRPKRTVFNVFLNLPEDKKINKDKIISVLDLPATLLESINFRLQNHAYGLGRSAFSNIPTLLEQLKHKLNNHLIQHSAVYDKLATPKSKHIDTYTPYTLGETLDNKACLSYTDIYENIINQYFLDRVNLHLQNLPQNISALKVHLKFSSIFLPDGILSIMANDTKVASFKPKKGAQAPYIIDFSVPLELITDNKLQLKFQNNSDVRKITTLGIAPLEIRVTAE